MQQKLVASKNCQVYSLIASWPAHVVNSTQYSQYGDASSQRQASVLTCEPLVSLPAFAIESLPGLSCFKAKFSSANFSPAQDIPYWRGKTLRSVYSKFHGCVFVWTVKSADETEDAKWSSLTVDALPTGPCPMSEITPLLHHKAPLVMDVAYPLAI